MKTKKKFEKTNSILHAKFVSVKSAPLLMNSEKIEKCYGVFVGEMWVQEVVGAESNVSNAIYETK